MIQRILRRLERSNAAQGMIFLSSGVVIGLGPLLIQFGVPPRPALGIAAIAALVLLALGLVDPWRERPSAE